jgi:hypothetical protein
MSRASLAAILIWSDEKNKSGDVEDAARNNALAIVCVDAILMLALVGRYTLTLSNPR